MQEILDWVLGNNQRVQGQFSFHVQYQPKTPFVGNTLVVRCFVSQTEKSPIPVRIKWFTAKDSAVTLVAEGANSLLCQPCHLAHELKIEIVSQSPTHAGTAYLVFPPLQLSQNLKQSLRKFIVREMALFPCSIQSSDKWHQCVSSIDKSSISIEHLDLGAKLNLEIKDSSPTVEVNQDQRQAILKSDNQDQLKRFAASVGDQRHRVFADQLLLRFQSRQARDLFYLCRKASEFRRNILSGLTLKSLQGQLRELDLDLLLQNADLIKCVRSQENLIQSLKAELIETKAKGGRLGDEDLVAENERLREQIRTLSERLRDNKFFQQSALINVSTIERLPKVNQMDMSSLSRNTSGLNLTAHLQVPVFTKKQRQDVKEIAERDQTMIREMGARLRQLQEQNEGLRKQHLKLQHQLARGNAKSKAMEQRLRSVNSMLQLSMQKSSVLKDNKLKRRVQSLLAEVDLLRQQKQVLLRTQQEMMESDTHSECKARLKQREEEADRLRAELQEVRLKGEQQSRQLMAANEQLIVRLQQVVQGGH